MTQLQQLAGQRAMIMIDSDLLLQYLREDREETFMEGVRQGRYLSELAAKTSSQKPYTKKEAADALGFSEGTIDNMRRRGELESYEYGGQVRIERAEVERFKRVHANNYNQLYNSKQKKK
ncbi:MAG: helix-turn-helix domain-containing protein [Paludibacteraceae bacterium]|nr:helix-turn-helix domain-containing protein [Paludibacteraceae bacterium]